MMEKNHMCALGGMCSTHSLTETSVFAVRSNDKLKFIHKMINIYIDHIWIAFSFLFLLNPIMNWARFDLKLLDFSIDTPQNEWITEREKRRTKINQMYDFRSWQKYINRNYVHFSSFSKAIVCEMKQTLNIFYAVWERIVSTQIDSTVKISAKLYITPMNNNYRI